MKSRSHGSIRSFLIFTTQKRKLYRRKIIMIPFLVLSDETKHVRTNQRLLIRMGKEPAR
jgi:hypothetical protein